MTKNLSTVLRSSSKTIRVVYISSYIPRKCGLATYTKDLTNAINLLNPHALAKIVVLHRAEDKFSYPKEVKFRIKQDKPESYLQAAEYINKSGADLVHLEHEFGLYGGENGNLILSLVDALKIPLVTTLHTVVDEPDSAKGEIIKQLIEKSEIATVMMVQIKDKLVKKYGVKNKKIVVIPHGTPDLPFMSTDLLKKKKRLSGRLILGNVNLLHPIKGIEFALESVALIAKKYPNVLYLVIGQTHPVYLREDKGRYRNMLKERVKELGIEKNVRFVNEYLSLKELIDWLRVVDFYVTPYLDPDQAASGALAYAVGAGKCCISTPFMYAKEVLAKDRGVLVPFRDPAAIADAVITLWENPRKKLLMEKKGYEYGRLMTWPNVALLHLELFRSVLSR